MGLATRAHPLTDAGAVATAFAAAIGAWWSPTVPWWAAAVAVLVVVTVRRAPVVIIAVAVVAAFLGGRAWQGDHPVAPGPFSARATLVGDPQEVSGAVVAEVRSGDHHLVVWARGPAGAVLDDRLAGEPVVVAGRQRPRPTGDLVAARRHVVGEVEASSVTAAGAGGPLARLANLVHARLEAGADALPRDRQPVYRGFVLGDVRGESPVVASDFAASGLAHLLVVSGENVAFVIAAAAPFVRRLGPRSRWTATIAILALFAAVTRFEPSVLRATAMAMIAVTAWTLGRPASGVRVLALAVTVVLLADPLLVGVAGFQLSVAAAAGIVTLASPLRRHLPLPRMLADPLSVTLAAQVAVSPQLCALWGGVPVATLPANLVAEPAAAALMVWGLTVGVVAGVVGGRVAWLLQLPADLLTWWVESVARWGAALPLGRVGGPGLAVAVGAGAVALWASGREHVALARTGWTCVLAALATPAVLLATVAPPSLADLPGAGSLWTAGGSGASVLVLTPGASVRSVLDGLRQRSRDHVALLVSPGGGPVAAGVVDAVRERIHLDHVWCGPPHQDDQLPCGGIGTTPAPGTTARVGDLEIRVDSTTPRLVVSVRVRGGRRGDGGPVAAGVGSPRAPVARSPPLRRDASGARDGHPQPHPGLVLRPGRLLRLRRLPAQGRPARGRRRRLPRRGWGQGGTG
jgi:competence protein ComEC